MNRYEKEQRKLQAKHEAGQARATHTQVITPTNPNALKNALKDYFANPGTSSTHVFHSATESGIGYDTLKRDYKLPEHAIDLLKAYKDASTVGRKKISLDLPKETRKTAIVSLANHAGVPVPARYTQG